MTRSSTLRTGTTVCLTAEVETARVSCSSPCPTLTSSTLRTGTTVCWTEEAETAGVSCNSPCQRSMSLILRIETRAGWTEEAGTAREFRSWVRPTSWTPIARTGTTSCWQGEREGPAGGFRSWACPISWSQIAKTETTSCWRGEKEGPACRRRQQERLAKKTLFGSGSECQTPACLLDRGCFRLCVSRRRGYSRKRRSTRQGFVWDWALGLTLATGTAQRGVSEEDSGARLSMYLKNNGHRSSLAWSR
jgi:hypothetical protein